jgi:hypothetical protein
VFNFLFNAKAQRPQSLAENFQEKLDDLSI